MNTITTATTTTDVLYSRYILAGLEQLIVVFGDALVVEIIVVERSYILPFPFFSSSMLGVIHHQGVVIPLLSLKRALLDKNALMPENLTVVRLSNELPQLAGAGIVVDRVLSSMLSEQYTKLAESSGNTYVRLENLLPRLPGTLWEPYRWHPANN
jgi:hypothetical protein